MILSPDLVKDIVPGPERSGRPGVLAGGDGDGLPLLAAHHLKVYLDQRGRPVRSAGASTQVGLENFSAGKSPHRPPWPRYLVDVCIGIPPNWSRHFGPPPAHRPPRKWPSS